MFIGAGNPLFWSLAASFRTGAAGAATIALINTIAQFGGLVGPWSIGLVRGYTGDFHYALLTIAGFLVVSVHHRPRHARCVRPRRKPRYRHGPKGGLRMRCDGLEALGVAFEHRSRAALMAVSTGSAERRAG